MNGLATALLAALITAGSLTALSVADPGASDFPDAALTPGAIASTDKAEICAWAGGRSYSQRHRQTTEEMKRTVLKAYNVPQPFRGEIDHRVPLCLGGADVPANLWPQLDYKGKDELEATTCREVCQGRMPLAEGQAIFLGDWRDRERSRQ